MALSSSTRPVARPQTHDWNSRSAASRATAFERHALAFDLETVLQRERFDRARWNRGVLAGSGAEVIRPCMCNQISASLHLDGFAAHR
jgi:hypothetical protein